MPRLTVWNEEMGRLGGGIGTRGPGETQLETDKRYIRSRIQKLRENLELVRKTRASAFPVNDITRLQDEIKELKEYVEAAFADYNDINEDTRMQLELINQAIAELQAKDKQAGGKTRNPIGFISYNKEK